MPSSEAINAPVRTAPTSHGRPVEGSPLYEAGCVSTGAAELFLADGCAQRASYIMMCEPTNPEVGVPYYAQDRVCHFDLIARVARP